MIRMDDVDVHAICIDQQLQEAEHIVDLIESTSDSGESEDQRPSPEVENRHASGTGSMGREDSGSGAAEKASTVDTGGAGSAQLVIPQAPCAQEVATAMRKSTRRMMRAGMMIARGRE